MLQQIDQQRAKEFAGKLLLNEAGFSRVEIVDSPRPQNCIFVCRKAGRSASRRERP